jgi:hypothetical protein
MKALFRRIAPALIVVAIGTVNLTVFAADRLYATKVTTAEASAAQENGASVQEEPSWKRVLLGICPVH